TGYFMRGLRLPNAPEVEQRSMVHSELIQLGALPPDSGGFDFLWMPPLAGAGHQAEVAAYYCNDATIDSIRQALRLAGLQLEQLEPASVSQMRAYIAAQASPRPVALLFPSLKYCDLFIHDGFKVRHVRRIPAGWFDV